VLHDKKLGTLDVGFNLRSFSLPSLLSAADPMSALRLIATDQRASRHVRAVERAKSALKRGRMLVRHRKTNGPRVHI
jgi:hypothetical protein